MTQTNSLESFCRLRSDQISSRPLTPLFHVSPHGCPFIAQRRTGRPRSLASAAASSRWRCQRTPRQERSFSDGRMNSLQWLRLVSASFGAGQLEDSLGFKIPLGFHSESVVRQKQSMAPWLRFLEDIRKRSLVSPSTSDIGPTLLHARKRRSGLPSEAMLLGFNLLAQGSWEAKV